eukprot:scaffold19072_cov112-Isochrysis_galbana.AAC.2
MARPSPDPRTPRRGHMPPPPILAPDLAAFVATEYGRRRSRAGAPLAPSSALALPSRELRVGTQPPAGSCPGVALAVAASAVVPLSTAAAPLAPPSQGAAVAGVVPIAAARGAGMTGRPARAVPAATPLPPRRREMTDEMRSCSANRRMARPHRR